MRPLKIRKTYKPGSVIGCHLSTTCVTTGLYQPTLRDWTSSPQASVYLVFQPIRFTSTGITDGGVSSYLAFSPLPLRAVYFLRHCLSSYDAFPLGSMVLYVARTFLSRTRRQRQPGLPVFL